MVEGHFPHHTFSKEEMQVKRENYFHVTAFWFRKEVGKWKIISAPVEKTTKF